MSRYTSILDGCEVNEESLNEGGFDYYLFERPGGSGVIMRLVTGTVNSRFYLFAGKNTQDLSATNAQAQWDDRVNKDYIRTSGLKSL
ncbi:MAG: hypothetical protein KR126chlam6_01230 [Candidatus Anoxychlamydiales bacterium]|nr:hypothetical protein [Candidatus Anoxychlamydiales bacterium]